MFGQIAGESAAAWAKKNPAVSELLPEKSSEKQQELLRKQIDVGPLIQRLQTENQRKLLICRTESGLKDVLENIRNLKSEAETAPTGDRICLDRYRLQSLLCAAQLMAEAALARKESCGSHYREDSE